MWMDLEMAVPKQQKLDVRIAVCSQERTTQVAPSFSIRDIVLQSCAMRLLGSANIVL